MRRWQIPTADFEAFDDSRDAMSYVRRSGGRVVVKADGLAADKGVVVARPAAEAEAVVVDLMLRRFHGPAGARVVMEECLDGEEASVLALVCGERVWPLVPAQDYKRAGDGDSGPNTGGMGALAPAPLPGGLMGQVIDQILEPVAAAMAREGRRYVGVLYAGIMITADGPKVLEFNCRFGDPEAQVILPLLQGSFADILLDVVHGRTPSLRWSTGAAACVVLASGGYPGSYRTGFPIAGLAQVPQDVRVFHAGTAVADARLVTAVGRVLNAVGLGPTLEGAVSRAYAGVAHIFFDGMPYRSDIGPGMHTGRQAEMASAPGGTE